MDVIPFDKMEAFFRQYLQYQKGQPPRGLSL